MWKFIRRRLLLLIPVLMGVTFIIYMIMSFAPGDPAKVILGEQALPEQIEALREEMGLNDPAIVQYARYVFDLFRLDMGTSYKTKNAVTDEITARFPNTLKLAVTSSLIAICMSLPLGIIAAVKQNTPIDGISMFLALLGVSMPVFWLGLLLILFFSLKLGWFPSGGAETWKSLVLPSCTLGFLHMAAIARTTRSSMLEVIRQDYIRTARSKGVAEGIVIR